MWGSFYTICWYFSEVKSWKYWCCKISKGVYLFLMSYTIIFYNRSMSSGSGLNFFRILCQPALGISGKFSISLASGEYFIKYYLEGVPIIFMTSINCSKALSPGKIGYRVRSSAKIHPADHTSTSVL
jgi:hypothetical protein